MIPIAFGDDGPDIEEVERLVASDASIKAMWCMPKYSNPTGHVYSDAVIERLAAMPAAAPDFRLFLGQRLRGSSPHRRARRDRQHPRAQRPARTRQSPFVFASTSKITLAGAGLALFASSVANVKWLLARVTPRTIGPDKLNQLRHVRFLRTSRACRR
jgi:DNA-binding transcriptional MocR family regulator